MKVQLIALLVMFFVGFSTLASAQTHKLVKLWETDSSLKVPESVLLDKTNNVLYVSNIDGQPWEKDGKGSIGKVSLDGKIIATDWVGGLQAPKGMGLYKSRLYVADMEEVVVIDITKGTIEKRLTVPGAQGLNDISISDNGVVYVSDSRGLKVFTIDGDVVKPHLESLQGPNGVLFHDKQLYVLDKGGLYKVGADKMLTKLAEGMEGGTDGVEHVTGDEFLVSCWAGSIWYVNANGTKENLLDTREQKINTADIGYDAQKRIVYVPTFWKNTVVAYQLQ